MAFLRNLLMTAGLLLIVQVAAAQGVGSIAGGCIPDGVSSEPNANEEGQGYVPPGASDSDTAIALMSSGSYEDAIPVLERIVRDNPKETESLFYLGFANSKLHRYSTALDYYLRAEKADPEHKGVHRYLGALYLQGDDLAHAEAELAALGQSMQQAGQSYRPTAGYGGGYVAPAAQSYGQPSGQVRCLSTGMYMSCR